ncbi:MAG: DUF4843 domain-containing protein [Bacteroidetes bacterium]|nr:DUF4843 domain-containing protein [Bacteroidota bacterium]
MRLKIAILLSVLAGFAACRKAQYMTYNTSDNVFFNFSDSTTDRDSVIYTFAFSPGKLSDTLRLPVSISGLRVSRDRKYKVVVSGGTTAVAGTHFEALKDTYTIPADSGRVRLALVLYNKDSLLSKRAVGLNLKMAATDDLGVALSGLINARIIISNRLEKPVWWDKWMSKYSAVKFKLFIIATGVTELAYGQDYGQYAPESLYYIGLMNNLIDDPLGWVAANPKKGYVLTLRQDGNYDFYSSGNPNDRVLLQYDAGTNSYHFIDENGNFVTPN